jgi:hypothetical protein
MTGFGLPDLAKSAFHLAEFFKDFPPKAGADPVFHCW